MFDILLKEEGGKPQNTTFPSLSALFTPFNAANALC